MTESNERSAAPSVPVLPAQTGSWKWIGLIVGLGFLVVCLNAAVFILLEQHQRGIAIREDDVRRRLVEATAKEARLDALKTELATLEQDRTVALRRKEDAEKQAADAERLQAERDRLFDDRRSAQADLSKLTAGIDGSKRQLDALKTENATASKAAGERAEEIKTLQAKRDALTADISKLNEQKTAADLEAESARKAASDAVKLKADRDNAYRDLQSRTAEIAQMTVVVETLKASQANIIVNQAATKRADDERATAEQSLAKARDEVQSTQQRLLELKAEVARLEQSRNNLAVDESAVQKAGTARKEAETSLSVKREELAETLKSLTAAQTELVAAQRLRQQVATDELAAKRAGEDRAAAEKALSTLEAQISDFQHRRDDASAQADAAADAKRQELNALNDELASTQNEIAMLEQRRRQIDGDEAAEKRAAENRATAEKALSVVQAQVTELEQRRDSTSAQLDSVRLKLNGEDLRLKELCSTFGSSVSNPTVSVQRQPLASGSTPPAAPAARPISTAPRRVMRPPATPVRRMPTYP